MKSKVITVAGPIDPADLGPTLVHEHIMVDLKCWVEEPAEAGLKALFMKPVSMEDLEWMSKNPFKNRDNTILSDPKMANEELMVFKGYGGMTIVDVTLRDLGRDPQALRAISSDTGINIIMGSGYYVNTSHPSDMDEKGKDDICDEIVSEIVKGVDNTGIKPGIIGEIGLVDLTKYPNEEKCLRGAAMAQLETGAPLTIHPPLLEDQSERILDILDEEGADLTKVIMGHMDVYFDDLENAVFLAEQGLYIEYDCWGVDPIWNPLSGRHFPSDLQRLGAVEMLVGEGCQRKILLSHDICLKNRLKSYGSHGYAHILRSVVPMFKEAGVSKEVIETMLVENPRKVLTFE